MQYMMLIYGSEQEMAKHADPSGKMMAGFREFTEHYRKTGHIKAGDALQPTSTATTVTVKDGKTVTTDGPFAETREQLGGYYLIEAKNLDEAIAIAAKIPVAYMGGHIEVRPVKVFNP